MGISPVTSTLNVELWSWMVHGLVCGATLIWSLQCVDSSDFTGESVPYIVWSTA